jgi:hypothetical protein
VLVYYGSIIGDFSGGGLESDVFSWSIFREDGTLVTARDGGFQVLSALLFQKRDLYKIQLNIRRGTTSVYSGEQELLPLIKEQILYWKISISYAKMEKQN